MFANKYVEKLKPYPVVSHKAWSLENTIDVLKLDWNEATIPPTPKVKEYILKFLEDGHLNWYPDVCNQRLLKLISDYVKLPVENLQYFAGSDSLHEYIVRTFLEPGDKVLIVAPTYDNFRAVVEATGCHVDYYFLDKNFLMDIDDFMKCLENYRPKLVYLCNPNNPTGTLYRFDDLKSIIVRHNDIMFIVDEAYYEFDGITCKDLVIEYDNLIISRTFSKAFALASFRIGYAISSKTNIELLSKVRNPKSISAFAQIAAIAALEDIEYMKNYVKEVNKAKAWFMEELEKLGIKAYGEGGNFVLISLKSDTKRRLVDFLEQKHIFVRDYSHVRNLENFIRITIGTRRQMEVVLEQIRAFGVI